MISMALGPDAGPQQLESGLSLRLSTWQLWGHRIAGPCGWLRGTEMVTEPGRAIWQRERKTQKCAGEFMKESPE